MMSGAIPETSHWVLYTVPAGYVRSYQVTTGVKKVHSHDNLSPQLASWRGTLSVIVDPKSSLKICVGSGIVGVLLGAGGGGCSAVV